MKKVGFLWDTGVQDWDRETPFTYERLNDEYRYFSRLGREKDVVLFPAHFSWYENGKLGKAFVCEDGEWRKKRNVEIDAVWDAFEFGEGMTELKHEIKDEMPILNSPETGKLCKDKLETYRRFPELMPETRKASRENVEEMLEENEKAVLKPRDDWGGEGVEIIESMEEFDSSRDSERWLVQEFVDTTEGIPGTDFNGVHDLRAVLVDGEMITGFVREPERGFVSNVAQGGDINVLPQNKFPKEALEAVEDVRESIEDLRPYLVTVDLIYDAERERFFVVELNSKPGMSYYGREDMKEAKTAIMEKLFEVFSSF